MTGPLGRRVTRLETAAGVGLMLPVEPCDTATAYGRVWEREPDEPQEAFLGRVADEAKSIRANCSVVVFLDTS
jgi:hypothetical protein